jgi:hypothetical protein
MYDLINRYKIVRLKADGTNYNSAAGTTAATSESVDTAGYDGVEFQVGFGAIVSGAATSIKVQQSAAANTGQADLAGTAQTIADTDDFKVARVCIYRPTKRFLNVVISKATQNSTVDFVHAILYGKVGKIPVTQDTTVQGTPEIFASPAEGTA